MLTISSLVWLPAADVEADRSELWWAVDVALGLVAFVLVFFRRRHPFAIAIVLALISAVSGTAGGPAVLAAVSLATRRRWREIAVVGSLSFAAAQLFSVMTSKEEDPAWLVLAANAIATSAMLGWGMYIGSRRELIWTLRNRAERAEEEQELRVAQARSTERARIAREMHDVLAHRISQVSMHAGALTFRVDLTADEMRASAGVIQQQAHEALTDLRGVLGVLRD
jgi:signal transduction histidine kinase